MCAAAQNVALGVDRVYPHATRAERADIVHYYLGRVGLTDSADKPATALSSGMRQRVGLARAFALSPKLLLLDEPFGMLDSLTRWELQELLMEVWARTRVTAICVTHDVGETLGFERVLVLEDGQIQEDGRPEELAAQPGSRYRALLDAEEEVRQGLWESGSWRRWRIVAGNLEERN